MKRMIGFQALSANTAFRVTEKVEGVFAACSLTHPRDHWAEKKSQKERKTANEWQISHSDTSPQSFPPAYLRIRCIVRARVERKHTHTFMSICPIDLRPLEETDKWPSGGLVGNAFWNYWRCRAAGMQRERQREAICAQIFCLFSVGNGDLLHRFRVGADSSRSLGCDCDADYSPLSWITGGYESKKVPSGDCYPRMKSSSLLAVSHVLLSRWDVCCKLFLTVMRF